MRALDDAVLTMLRTGADPLNVFDGEAEVDETQKVITAPMPYVVFLSTEPSDDAQTYAGNVTRSDLEFQLMYVGLTRDQAKAVGERAMDRIWRQRPGDAFGLIRRTESQRVVREKVYTAPGGEPLFYGVSVFAVAV